MIIFTNKKGQSIEVDNDFVLPDGYSLSITSHGYGVMCKATGVRLPSGSYRYERVYIHRFIMKPRKGYQVDHVNGDRLDNRKGNLRVCTNASNNANKPAIKGQYKGVHFSESSGYWVAQITKNRKCQSLGRFTNPHDAAEAYNKAARRLFGKYAWRNDIKEPLLGLSAKVKPRSRKERHGYKSEYDRGCRCDVCVTPQNKVRKRDTHGTVECYKRGLCRCNECSIASREYKRKYNKK